MSPLRLRRITETWVRDKAVITATDPPPREGNPLGGFLGLGFKGMKSRANSLCPHEWKGKKAGEGHGEGLT